MVTYVVEAFAIAFGQAVLELRHLQRQASIRCNHVQAQVLYAVIAASHLCAWRLHGPAQGLFGHHRKGEGVVTGSSEMRDVACRGKSAPAAGTEPWSHFEPQLVLYVPVIILLQSE